MASTSATAAGTASDSNSGTAAITTVIMDADKSVTANFVPDLPDQYHDILIYKGIELFAIHIGNSELYQTYSKEYHKQLGVLMRTFLPSREVYLRGGIA